ncbi:MAG: hypothetical protein H6717_15630 [Polyangiaceae bacterium]|nr:hypothetical protein [Polyangiaceae bacterium]
MRPLLVSLTLAVFLLVGLSSSTARADQQARSLSGTTALLLLDGFRNQQASTVATTGRPATPRTHTDGAEPGNETLRQAVERMWSQVRAYRRPGGAEVIVRGRF